ncbi:MAG: hypothetical protein HY907_21880 [Deltaproteobacteria bacterium]|nr:hypothetical protein [Deltaproteobacteria bacterium]
MSKKGLIMAGVGVLTAGAAILSFVVWLMFSRNPETPAGYVGYVTQSAWFGEAEFVGLQTGPTSPGRGWLLKAINVSVTPYTYTEPFGGPAAVLSKDRLMIQFEVHVTWRVRPDRVREFVERFAYGDSSSPDKLVADAYKNFIREPLRSFAREEVQKLHSMAIADAITGIGERVFERLTTMTRDTPFDVMKIVVGNIQFPESVAQAVAAKMAAQQLLEQQQTEVDIAKKQAEIRIAEATGIAEAMRIINERLTQAYLQHEAIEAQKAMVGSPNHSTVYIPVGPMGVPLVGTFPADRSVPGPQPAPPPPPPPPPAAAEGAAAVQP